MLHLDYFRVSWPLYKTNVGASFAAYFEENFDIDSKPFGYHFVRGKATEMVPYVCNCWLDGRSAV